MPSRYVPWYVKSYYITHTPLHRRAVNLSGIISRLVFCFYYRHRVSSADLLSFSFITSDLRCRNPRLSGNDAPRDPLGTQTSYILHTVQAKIPGSETTAPPAKAEHRLFVCT